MQNFHPTRNNHNHGSHNTGSHTPGNRLYAHHRHIISALFILALAACPHLVTAQRFNHGSFGGGGGRPMAAPAPASRPAFNPAPSRPQPAAPRPQPEVNRPQPA